MLYAKFGWISPNGSGEEDEKFTDRRTNSKTDKGMDDGQAIRKAHLRFQLRWAKKTKFVILLFNDVNDTDTENRQILIKKAHLSFQLRWA